MSPALKAALQSPVLAVPTVVLALVALTSSALGAVVVGAGAFFPGLALMTLSPSAMS